MTRRDAIALLLAPSLTAQDLDLVPLEVTVPTPPTAIPAGGEHVLIYELHITHMGSTGPIEITKIEVGLNGKWAPLHGELLNAMSRRVGVPHEDPPTLLSPGMRAVVHMFLGAKSAPDTVTHRLTMKPGGLVNCLPVQVRRDLLTLAPPVRGDNWLAANGPAAKTHHRWSMMPFQGRSVIPQRYAIDWLQREADGSMHQGDGRRNEQHRCYGTEVLAVRDGAIAAVYSGVPDTNPGEKPTTPVTLETIGGNQVILEMENGLFAVYAHLKPQSIRVKRGDIVRKGQVLALIGNSGVSAAPHLHFQVADAPALLGGEGLPYVIDEFRRDGKAHKGELPLQDWVVEF
jgi:hypothetical protein